MQEVTSQARPLAVTSGEPAGIGLEITIRAWLRRNDETIPVFALFADAVQAELRAHELGLPAAFERVGKMSEARDVFARAIPVVDVPQLTPAVAGHPDTRNGAAVVASIERAAAAVAAGDAAALVTNPIAKNVLYEAGFQHPGHTEFLAELADGAFPGGSHRSVMLLACDELKVVPLTVHVPLASVPGLVTRELILETVRITHAALIRDFALARPRISVAGLNPHAGEAGTIGREDEAIIGPAIETLCREGLTVTGPHSADTLFHAGARQTYDCVVAMYHDQALIPIKTLAFDRGVNVTLGLPFVRTSPDHGTAFDIAALGCARPVSLIEALKLARDIARRRAAAGS